ncbi:phosphatidylinositol-4-phosphate 5-, putative [Ichthyophthirius multifiliis]|uniref:MORN repeat-containing protein 3 n=1 Tax=Ichthyophthirius multifiliis TaxID=5932 RepID=G0QU75_ICHMU|nr:phosphatidylinositol-4-phosphate 5-, putative [Ichthyophthirius multifiliis]EGR31233.1 phosphatidylinositol-4-phosphate 5-, putative [Ichthyophthirius multifiliis]|eukprot:XP_004034719.1 phosphatidylinositol-4-phosphate 5-, putative [Ichthyophthirius multifiliis]
MGGIKNNGRDSYGTFYFSNGNIYEGQWKDNDQNGFGKFYFAQDGKLFQFYVGNFYNSLYQGFGGYCYQNKYYIGYWSNDKYEGHGKIYSNDGKLIVCGIYSNDKLIKELNESEIVFPSYYKDYIPNYQVEHKRYKEILDVKPIA